MKGFDFDHPFFDPLWIRVAIVIVCLAWGAFEAWNGAHLWAAGFVALGLWSGYHFFIVKPHRGDDT